LAIVIFLLVVSTVVPPIVIVPDIADLVSNLNSLSPTDVLDVGVKRVPFYRTNISVPEPP